MGVRKEGKAREQEKDQEDVYECFGQKSDKKTLYKHVKRATEGARRHQRFGDARKRG